MCSIMLLLFTEPQSMEIYFALPLLWQSNPFDGAFITSFCSMANMDKTIYCYMTDTCESRFLFIRKAATARAEICCQALRLAHTGQNKSEERSSPGCYSHSLQFNSTSRESQQHNHSGASGEKSKPASAPAAAATATTKCPQTTFSCWG